MKVKAILFSIFVLSALSLSAQLSDNIKRHYTNSFDVFTDLLVNTPENFSPRAINQGFGMSASYVIPFEKSNFSVAIGAGVSFHNFYSDALPKDAIPTDLQSESWGEDFYFQKIDSIQNGLSYTKNKIALTYVDIPIELRFCAKSGVKFSAGIKLGFLVNSLSKYKGTDFIYGTESTIKYKKCNIDNLSSFQLGPVVRVGWKWFSAYAAYSLIPVYDATGGSKINPISLGISFTPGY